MVYLLFEILCSYSKKKSCFINMGVRKSHDLLSFETLKTGDTEKDQKPK